MPPGIASAPSRAWTNTGYFFLATTVIAPTTTAAINAITRRNFSVANSAGMTKLTTSQMARKIPTTAKTVRLMANKLRVPRSPCDLVFGA